MSRVSKQRKRRRDFIILTAFLGFLLVLGAVFYDYANSVLIPDGQERIQEIKYAIRGNLTSPYSIDPSEPVTISVGTISTNYTVEQLSGGIDLTKIVSIEQDNKTIPFPVQIYFKNNTLFVNAQVYDANNNLLVNIQANEWKAVSPNSELIWDRNYNGYAFELLDENKTPALQILMGGNNTIDIGFSLFTQGIQDYFGITTGTYVGGITPEDLQTIKSSTLFKYPSSQYPYELMNSTSYPYSDPLAEANGEVQNGHYLSIGGVVLMAIFGVGEGAVVAEYLKKPEKKGK